jgi:hypothetical protein
MDKIEIAISDIPHGHGLSFKKGVADGILDSKDYESTCHETHKASYLRGCEVGKALKEEIAKKVKA